MYASAFLSALLMASMTAASPQFVPRAAQCGVHVTQWQMNENGVGGAYEFDAKLYDKNGMPIGSLNRQPTPADMTSSLPFVLLMEAGSQDSDPIRFSYAGDTWYSDEGSRCSVGGYDSGHRDMDCGFSC